MFIIEDGFSRCADKTCPFVLFSVVFKWIVDKTADSTIFVWPLWEDTGDDVFLSDVVMIIINYNNHIEWRSDGICVWFTSIKNVTRSLASCIVVENSTHEWFWDLLLQTFEDARSLKKAEKKIECILTELWLRSLERINTEWRRSKCNIPFEQSVLCNLILKCYDVTFAKSIWQSMKEIIVLQNHIVLTILFI